MTNQVQSQEMSLVYNIPNGNGLYITGGLQYFTEPTIRIKCYEQTINN